MEAISLNLLSERYVIDYPFYLFSKLVGESPVK